MPSTYTSGLRLTNQPTGGNATTWGTIADDNFEFVDDAITGIVTVDLTGGSSYTLTNNNGSDDEARKALIYVKGIPTSANSVIIPASEKIYDLRFMHTSVSGGITIRTNTGTGVSFSTSNTGRVYCDGASVWSLASPLGLLPANNLSDLTNVSAALSTLGIANTGDLFGIVSVRSPLEVSASALQINTSALFVLVWPIGSIYMNRTDGTNPGTLMGFGTWVSAGLGRVPIGVGTGVDINGVSAVVSAQTCGGEYQHTLTTAEMTKHRHVLPRQTNVTLGGGNTGVNPNDTGTFDVYTCTEGSSSAFNIVQPWFSVYFWQRTA